MNDNTHCDWLLSQRACFYNSVVIPSLDFVVLTNFKWF